MRNVAILIQLLREDRARLISRLDWLFEVLEDHRIGGGEKSLLEQAFLFELERYTELEDEIVRIGARGPFMTETWQGGQEEC